MIGGVGERRDRFRLRAVEHRIQIGEQHAVGEAVTGGVLPEQCGVGLEDADDLHVGPRLRGSEESADVPVHEPGDSEPERRGCAFLRTRRQQRGEKASRGRCTEQSSHRHSSSPESQGATSSAVTFCATLAGGARSRRPHFAERSPTSAGAFGSMCRLHGRITTSPREIAKCTSSDEPRAALLRGTAGIAGAIPVSRRSRRSRRSARDCHPDASCPATGEHTVWSSNPPASAPPALAAVLCT